MPVDFFQTFDSQTAREKILTDFGIQTDILKIVEDSDLKDSFEPVLLEKKLNREEFLRFAPKLSRFPGIIILESATREYTAGEYLSHVLGYLGKIDQEEYQNKKNQGYLFNDYLGKEGIEFYYERDLRGYDGQQIVEVDSKNRPKKIISEIRPMAGKDIKLTLNLDLQKKLFDRLNKELKTAKVTKAAAVAIDPRDGSILALVSLPSFNNNLFSAGISASEYSNLISSPDQPLFNRVISGVFPPGSSIKPLIGSAALEAGIIKPEQKVNCAGGLVYYGFGGSTWVFPDEYTYGFIDIKRAIAVSCNTFFYVLGGGFPDYKIDGLGVDRIGYYANLFGLGTTSGIDLPGEAAGLVPTIKWKEETKGERWYIGDTYHISIGQGDLTATPLQLANYIAAIASGGKLYQPHLLMETIDNLEQTRVKYESQIIRQNFIKPDNLRIIRDAMRQTVTEGSGRKLADLDVAVAGKTGTAQCAGCGSKTHSWFLSFAPFDQPTIVLAVLIEEAGAGHEHAVPVVRDVYEWYFSSD